MLNMVRRNNTRVQRDRAVQANTNCVNGERVVYLYIIETSLTQIDTDRTETGSPRTRNNDNLTAVFF